MAIDEDLASTSNTGTTFVRDGELVLSGTWAGTAALKANIGGAFHTVEEFTENVVRRIEFASITEVRVDFTRTSGTLSVDVTDDALGRRR